MLLDGSVWEIATGLIDWFFIFFDSWFNFKLEIYPGVWMKLGVIAIAYLTILLVTYFVLRALGVIGDD